MGRKRLFLAEKDCFWQEKIVFGKKLLFDDFLAQIKGFSGGKNGFGQKQMVLGRKILWINFRCLPKSMTQKPNPDTRRTLK